MSNTDLNYCPRGKGNGEISLDNKVTDGEANEEGAGYGVTVTITLD
jgi:hypothetical protein